MARLFSVFVETYSNILFYVPYGILLICHLYGESPLVMILKWNHNMVGKGVNKRSAYEPQLCYEREKNVNTSFLRKSYFSNIENYIGC